MYSILNTCYQTKRRDKDEIIKHLISFSLDLKIPVGIWYFTPSGVRFHESCV